MRIEFTANFIMSAFGRVLVIHTVPRWGLFFEKHRAAYVAFLGPVWVSLSRKIICEN